MSGRCGRLISRRNLLEEDILGVCWCDGDISTEKRQKALTDRCNSPRSYTEQWSRTMGAEPKTRLNTAIQHYLESTVFQPVSQP